MQFPLLGVLPTLLLGAAVHRAAACRPCDQSSCPGSGTQVLGTHRDINSAACPEGSVATLEALRASAATGRFEVVIRNDGGYAYKTVSHDVACFEMPDAETPVVGNQRSMQVTLNCESVRCNFHWDVRFGCQESGTLVTDKEGGGVQVLSDIDDTIVCPNPTCDSLGGCVLKNDVKHYLAGKDRRLEAGEFYPGVAELMLGLALGPGGGPNGTESDAHQYKPARPILLSARPREFSSIIGIDQDAELNVYMEVVGHALGHPSWGANVDGSFYGLLLDGTSFKEFGQTKARSFNSISGDSPNTRFVFLGDNGQGDVCAAQSMLESASRDRLKAVLIHLTQDPANAQAHCESPEDEDFTLNLPEGPKVHYFKAHSEAALWAYNQSLISCCSAQAVYDAVHKWRSCRCREAGEAEPAGGCQLPTGVGSRATRSETLHYCKGTGADQEALLPFLEACDPERQCSEDVRGTQVVSHSCRESLSAWFALLVMLLGTTL